MPLISKRIAEPGQDASRAAPPAGDACGFAVFYDENFHSVLGFVTRRTNCPQLAADLTADIFLAALKNGRAKAVRFTTLAALCEVLDCQPGDLLRWEAESLSDEATPAGRLL